MLSCANCYWTLRKIDPSFEVTLSLQKVNMVRYHGAHGGYTYSAEDDGFEELPLQRMVERASEVR